MAQQSARSPALLRATSAGRGRSVQVPYRRASNPRTWNARSVSGGAPTMLNDVAAELVVMHEARNEVLLAVSTKSSSEMSMTMLPGSRSSTADITSAKTSALGESSSPVTVMRRDAGSNPKESLGPTASAVSCRSTYSLELTKLTPHGRLRPGRAGKSTGLTLLVVDRLGYPKFGLTPALRDLRRVRGSMHQPVTDSH
jgi:hypothetical protein